MSGTAWVDSAWEKAIMKLDRTSERIGAAFPHKSENGRYEEEDISWWTNGFWPGIMWILYRDTLKEKFRRIAQECEAKLDKALSDFYGLHHDVGFMWILSAVADYRITGNPDSRRRGMIAASYLASRFNIKGGFIRAWNDDKTGWTIIDSMMNVPLLYWASEESKDPRFRFIAEAHADKVLAHFVREDGSVHHIVNFDPFTGDFVESFGGQGYCLGSSWTRGQAWAIHGFALSHNHTGYAKYLDAAKRISHYFLASLPPDSVPPCDFRCPPEGSAYKDVTAGACAASGMLEIARSVPALEAGLYTEGALRILKSLYENYGDWDGDEEGLLTKGTMSYHQERGRNRPLIYGDFFYLEALAKLRGETRSLW